MRLDLGDRVAFNDADCGALLRGDLSYSIGSHTRRDIRAFGWYMDLMASLWDCLRLGLSQFLIEDSQDES